MLKRLILVGIAIVITGARYLWREHANYERRSAAALNEVAPALNSMSENAIADSTWTYSGPLGSLTLRFKRGGKLEMEPASQPEGRWEIRGTMLYAYIPGIEKPHMGIFRTSANELTGPGPGGSGNWSATRNR